MYITFPFILNCLQSVWPTAVVLLRSLSCTSTVQKYSEVKVLKQNVLKVQKVNLLYRMTHLRILLIIIIDVAAHKTEDNYYLITLYTAGKIKL